MEQIVEYLDSILRGKGILIAVASYIIGEIVKTLKIPKKYIPLIGGLTGVLFSVLSKSIFVGSDIVTKIIMGLALGWSATGGYETIKNLKKEGKK